MKMIVQLLSVATVYATGDTGGTPYDASIVRSPSVLLGADNKIPFIPMSGHAPYPSGGSEEQASSLSAGEEQGRAPSPQPDAAVTSGSFMTIQRHYPTSCIESTDHENGGEIHLHDCDSSNWNQRWTWTSSGQIKLLGTLWCLDGQPESFGTLHLWTCEDNNWNQMWTYNAEYSICLKGTSYCMSNIFGGFAMFSGNPADWFLEYGAANVKMSANGTLGTPIDGDVKQATPTPSAEPMLAPEPEVNPMDRMFTELARVRIGDIVCFERLVAKLSRTSCSALASVLSDVPCARDYVQPGFEVIADYVCRYMGDVDFSKTMQNRSFPDLS